MRIGINAQKLFVTQDYRNAGVSRYIGEIARRLPLVAEHERFVLYTNEHVQTWPGVEGERLRLSPTRMPTTNPLARIMWEQTVLPLLALRDGLDLLHCPLNVRPIVARVPVALTIHDLTFMKYPERFGVAKQRYLAAFTRYSARHSRVILADSAATKRDVVEAFGVPDSRVRVVYSGVDEDFRPHRDEAGQGSEALAAFCRRRDLPERVVLYLGTLEPRKNVDKLVRAFARLVGRGLPHSLVLAGGKGWQYEAIFRAVEECGVKDRVVFPGYVPREEQPLWYNAADLFVYPSQYEGFGLPPLEAMACGVPVITSDTSSLPEVVGTAGATVDPGDIESLTETMVAVLTDPARASQMRRAGIVQAAQFNWLASAQACLAAYRLVLGNGALT